MNSEGDQDAPRNVEEKGYCGEDGEKVKGSSGYVSEQ